MDNETWNRFNTCRTYIKYALAGACKKEPRDLEHELQAVLAEANVFADMNSRPHVTIEDVRRADQLAMGHIDWSSKLPLYVAEAVFGVASWQKYQQQGRGPGQ